MTRQVMTCRPHDNLERAAQLMWDHDCGVLPVIAAEDALVGMVTDRDTAMGAYTQGRALRDISVETVMSRAVTACHPQDTVSAALEAMRASQVRRLPVVDDARRVVGLIALNDIVHAVSERNLRAPREREVVEALAAIGRSRHEAAPAVAPLASRPPRRRAEGGIRDAAR